MMTTDFQEEIFPLVNEQNKVIGIIPRSKAHASPHQTHRAIYVIVINDVGKWLIQKRSHTKDTFPNALDLSVGGHVNSGDTYTQTATRELHEELGVLVNESDLTFVGETLVTLPWEKEFFQVFEYRIKSTDHIHIDSTEVSATKYMTIGDIKKSLQKDRNIWSGKVHQIIEALYS